MPDSWSRFQSKRDLDPSSAEALVSGPIQTSQVAMSKHVPNGDYVGGGGRHDEHVPDAVEAHVVR